MTTLIASLGSGKGTWAELFKLMKAEDWDKIILIANPFFSRSFQEKSEHNEKVLVLTVDYEKEKSKDIIEKLSQVFNKEVVGVEVALNMSSGTGEEHMLILASILKAGLGIRLVKYEDEGVTELL